MNKFFVLGKLSLLFLLSLTSLIPLDSGKSLILKDKDAIEYFGQIADETADIINFEVYKVQFEEKQVENIMHLRAQKIEPEQKFKGTVELIDGLNIKGVFQLKADGNLMVMEHSYLPHGHIFNKSSVLKISSTPESEVTLINKLFFNCTIEKDEAGKYSCFTKKKIELMKANLTNLPEDASQTQIITKKENLKQEPSENKNQIIEKEQIIPSRPFLEFSTLSISSGFQHTISQISSKLPQAIAFSADALIHLHFKQNLWNLKIGTEYLNYDQNQLDFSILNFHIGTFLSWPVVKNKIFLFGFAELGYTAEWLSAKDIQAFATNFSVKISANMGFHFNEKTRIMAGLSNFYVYGQKNPIFSIGPEITFLYSL